MKKTFFILLIASLFLLVFDKVVGFGLARDITQNFFAPLEVGLHEIGVKASKTFVFLLRIPEVYTKNQTLQEELGRLQDFEAENQLLKEENKSLREQLGVSLEEGEVEILACVLGEMTQGEKIFLLINKGTTDGVESGDIVLYRKFLLGKVVVAERRQAQVLPIFSNDSKVPVAVLSAGKKVNGLVVGKYNSQIKLVEVLQEETLASGDLVVSSGAAGTYPIGLLIGKVKKIEREEDKLFQEANLSMFWDVKELQNVFILK